MKKVLQQSLLSSCLLLLMTTIGLAQTTIVNYDFNSGTSYGALTPALAANITSTASGSETFATFGGTAATTGQGAFTANSTPGNALAMSNSSGTTKYFQFQLGGSALANYASYQIFLQARRSGTGATTLTLQYSTNGTSWTSLATTGSSGNDTFAVITYNLSTGAAATALNNKSSVYFRLVASGASGGGTLRIDNFQIQATAAVPPSVTTATATGITAYTATSGGNVSSSGSTNLSAKGVVWTTSSSTDPTVDLTTKTTTTGTATGNFTSNITALEPNTTYYYRAYATNTGGQTGYGAKLSFTTLAIPAVTTTTPATDVTSSSAKAGGNVTAQGTTAVTERGVVWSTSQNPTITSNLGITTDGDGTGTFTSTLTGLNINTTYYYRAYATNAQGTAYGTQSSFTTLNISKPTVVTTAFNPQNDATANSAIFNGGVSNNGGAAITQRGFIWNTTGTGLTVGETTTIINTDANDTDAAFSDSVTGLVPNTQYYYTAFATNSAGTGYGSINNFYTHAAIPGAPVVSNATTTSLTVTADANGNPAATQYVIRVLVGANYYYVNEYSELQSQPVLLAGTFVASPLTIQDLNPGTNYTFDVKARNVSGIETAWSNPTTQATVSPTTPYFSLLSANLEFGNVCINTTATGQFVFSATNLAVNEYITIYNQTGFTYSLTENGTYQNALLFQNPGGNITVYVHFTPTLVQGYPQEVNGVPGTINISAANTGTLNVPVSGAGVNAPAAAITGISADVTATTATLAGQVTQGCSAITAYGIEYSTTGGFADGAGTQIASGNIAGTAYTASLSGLTACTAYYYKAYVTDATGTYYGAQQTFSTLTIAAAPVATAAGTITQIGFTANWTAVPGAAGYYLDVSTSPDFENVLLSEDFADVSTPPGDTEITNTLSTYGLAGWSGVRIYGESGLIRMGISGTIGNVTTPTVNLANNSGNATLTFSTKHIGGSDAGKSIRVLHAPNGTSFSQVGSDILLPAGLETQTIAITGGTANSKIRITGAGAVPNRFNVDDVKIAYSQSLPSYSNLAVSGTSHEVTGLNPGTKYYYRVRAYGANCTSGHSNTIEAETLSYLTLAASNLEFGDVCTNSSENGSFTISGSGLTDATINIAAQQGFSYSLTETGTYTNTLSLSNYNGGETIVYVQFAPEAVQSYNTSISLTGSTPYAAATLTVPVTGAGIYTPAIATAGAATAITMVSATLPGQSAAGNCSATTAYGVEYSTINNFENGSGIQVAAANIDENGNYSIDLEGLNPCTSYYYKAYTTTTDGTVYSAQRTFTTTAIAAPVAADGTAVSQDSFTATWQPVENASGYRLDVSTNPEFETSSTGITTTETFTNIPASSSSYATRTWTGDDSIGWSATDASTNQTLDGRAILLRVGSLTNTTVISGGISRISFDYIRAFTTGNPILKVFINGQQYGGDLTVTATQQVFNLDLNISGNIDIELRNTGGTSARTIIDNLEIKRLDVNNEYYVTGYKNVDVNDVTEFAVTGLEEFTTYYYRVRAYSANCTTVNSNVIAVNTKGMATWKVDNGTAKWVPEYYSDGTTPVIIDNTIPVAIETDYDTAVNGIFTAESLTLNNGTFTVAGGTSLTIGNGIVNNLGAEHFIVENNGNLLQNNEQNNLNSDAITVYRDSSPLYRQDYTMWSSPVTGQNMFGFSPSTLANRFYTYDSAQDQFATVQGLGAASATTFDAGRGYLIRMPNGGVDANGNPTGTTSSPAEYQLGNATMVYNGKFTGVPNNGTITVPLSNAGSGFNLIGNPYPSPINISQFLAANQSTIDGTVWIWRKTNASTNTAYCTINRTGQYVDNDEPNTAINPAAIIRTGQGFIVQLAAGATGNTVAFNNTMRSADTSNQFFRNGAAAAHMGENLPESHGIYLNLTNSSGFFSQMYTGYIEGATAGADSGIDSKYINDKATVLSTVLDGEEYIIHGRALPFSNQNIEPLHLRVAAAGTYSISIGRMEGLFAEGQEVFIKDNFTGAVHNLTEGAYTFSTEAGTFGSRLEVIYTNGALGTADPVAGADSLVIYKQDSDIIINSGNTDIKAVTVFDLRGRMIYTDTKVNATAATIHNLPVQQQVLIVQVTTADNKVISRKIVF